MIPHRNSDTYSWSEKQVEALMENSLIGLITKTEALQKLVCKTHHLVHSNISLLHKHYINHAVLHPATANYYLFSCI